MSREFHLLNKLAALCNTDSFAICNRPQHPVRNELCLVQSPDAITLQVKDHHKGLRPLRIVNELIYVDRATSWKPPQVRGLEAGEWFRCDGSTVELVGVIALHRMLQTPLAIYQYLAAQRWRLCYLHLVLGCDSPVLEAYWLHMPPLLRSPWSFRTTTLYAKQVQRLVNLLLRCGFRWRNCSELWRSGIRVACTSVKTRILIEATTMCMRNSHYTVRYGYYYGKEVLDGERWFQELIRRLK